jgi:hypothetical protein
MLLIDRLRGHMDLLTDEAADEIESLEKSYASLFKDCDKAQRDRAALVDALEECTRVLSDLQSTQLEGTRTRSAWEKARAALAKARGE